MKKIDINIQMELVQAGELNDSDRELVEKAKQATHNSYANYSHFYVGAALRLSNGQIVVGANQENAAFPSGLCAERSAIFAAQSQMPDQAIVTLAIAARNANGYTNKPISPCGACRQVILEMEDRYKRNVRILLYGETGICVVRSVKDLLPLTFVDADMR